MTCTRILMACATTLLTVSLAHTAPAETASTERFTFSVPGISGRLDAIVTRWSTDAERDRVVSVLKQDGADKLPNALRESSSAGYINWPGSLSYTLRYARRTPRPDGGEDIVLIADHRLWHWWGSAPSADSSDRPFTVIQLRLDKDGRGEAKASSNIVADAGAGVVLENYASQPLVLTDMRRERPANDSSTF